MHEALNYRCIVKGFRNQHSYTYNMAVEEDHVQNAHLTNILLNRNIYTDVHNMYFSCIVYNKNNINKMGQARVTLYM